MNEFDGHKIDRKALEEIRIRAVKRVEAGESLEVVIKALRRRKASGRPPKLSANALQKIHRMVVGKDPRQLKFPFALWTKSMVRELIRCELDVHLSDVSVGRLLHTLGLSPQRPAHRAYQQNQVLVVDWRRYSRNGR